MYYMLATYQIMSMTVLNMTVGLIFNPVNEDVVRDILYDIEEEEKNITTT